jgi:phage antirepressor YoqD-like protein
VPTPGGDQDMLAINESGLYSAILRSKRKEAKKFKKWVTSEVLPSIRKHGAYMTAQVIEDVLSDPDTIIRLAQDLKAEQTKRRVAEEKRLKAEAKNKKLKPKADYADAVIGAGDTVSIRDWVNSLKSDRGLKVGERKVIKLLVDKDMIYRKGKEFRAYAKYDKYFSLVPLVTTTQKGSKQRMQLRVTGLGQVKVGDRVVKHFNEEAK